MAAQNSKKLKSSKKRQQHVEPTPLPPASSLWASKVIGRVVQLVSSIGLLYGLSNLPGLLETYMQWEKADASDQLLAQKWLRCFVPSCLGGSVLLYAEHSLRRLRAVEKSFAENPDQPWLAEPRWKDGRIRMEERGLFRWTGFVMLLLVFTIIPLSISMQWEATGTLCWLAGILGVLFVFNGWRDTKYYSGELKLGTLPGVIGGPLIAAFTTNQRFPENTVFEATLLCDRHVPGEDDEPSRRERVWSDTIQIGKQLASQSTTITAVPLSFSIPFHCPPSTLLPGTADKDQDIRWTLSIGTQSGWSRPSSFLVPVFRTAHSRPTHDIADNELQEAYQPVLDEKSVVESCGMVELKSELGESQWLFHHREGFVFTAGLTLIACCLAAIIVSAVLIPRLIRHREAYVVVVFVSIIPAFVMCIAIYTVLDAWLWQCRIVPDDKSLNVHCGWKGFRKTYQLPRDKTTSVAREIFMHQKVGELWDLLLKHPSLPRKIVLLKRINSKSEAILLQEKLGKQLGIGIEGD